MVRGWRLLQAAGKFLDYKEPSNSVNSEVKQQSQNFCPRVLYIDIVRIYHANIYLLLEKPTYLCVQEISTDLTSMLGWGVDGIIAISKLAVKVYTAYKNVPNSCRHVFEEVVSLQIKVYGVLQCYERTTLRGHDRQLGQEVLKSCQSVLEDLDSIIEKYNTLSSANMHQVFKEVQLGEEDIATLRGRLILNTVLLHGFIQRSDIPI